jgi:hypothetical protein
VYPGWYVQTYIENEYMIPTGTSNLADKSVSDESSRNDSKGMSRFYDLHVENRTTLNISFMANHT